MDSNANANDLRSPLYLKALNVQNALGYVAHGWREYENALGNGPTCQARTRYAHSASEYVGQQVLLAVLGELA